jgi:hypothetical protein
LSNGVKTTTSMHMIFNVDYLVKIVKDSTGVPSEIIKSDTNLHTKHLSSSALWPEKGQTLRSNKDAHTRYQILRDKGGGDKEEKVSSIMWSRKQRLKSDVLAYFGQFVKMRTISCAPLH